MGKNTAMGHVSRRAVLTGTAAAGVMGLTWFPARLQPWLSRLAAGPAE